MTTETQQLLQLYFPLIAPIGTLAIVVVFIFNNSRLNDFNTRFNEPGSQMKDMRGDPLRAIRFVPQREAISRTCATLSKNRMATFSESSRNTNNG